MGEQVRLIRSTPQDDPPDAVFDLSHPETSGMPQILSLSARSSEALSALARRYLGFLDSESESDVPIDYICYTASVRRTHHEFRLAVVANNKQEFIVSLNGFLGGTIQAGVYSGETKQRHKIAFIFSGQGSQWLGMGKRLLLEEPFFADTIKKCDEAGREQLGWSLLDLLANSSSESSIADIEYLQPLLFAIQVGLSAIWRSWGIQPGAVVGHSMGEIAAAHVAGSIGLSDALRIIGRRSQLLKSTRGNGAMILVKRPVEQLSSALVKFNGGLSIAAINSPNWAVVSGDKNALASFIGELQQEGADCHRINVDVASHCAQMDGICIKLREVLKGVKTCRGSIPIYSTVTGTVCDGREFDGEYWARNLREPVLFSPAIKKLLADGYDTFLEISPHPALTTSIHETSEHFGYRSVALGSLKREESLSALFRTLGMLYTLGFPLEWGRVYSRRGRIVSLPSYPWQRQRFLNPDPASVRPFDAPLKHSASDRNHCISSAAHTGMHFWETEVGVAAWPSLRHHRIKGIPVLPALVFLELVSRAAFEALGSRPIMFRNVSFMGALFLREDLQRIQVVLSSTTSQEAAWQFFSLQAGAESIDSRRKAWALHARGSITFEAPPSTGPETVLSLEEVQRRCSESMSKEEYYQLMADWGLEYGPSFQGITEVWKGEDEAIARVSLPENRLEAESYWLPPALLDSCFHVLFATFMNNAVTPNTYLPIGFDSLRIYERPQGSLWSYARAGRRRLDTDGLVEGDLIVLDERRLRVIEVSGLRLGRLEPDQGSSGSSSARDWCYKIRWERRPPDLSHQHGLQRHMAGDGRWLILADIRGTAESLRKLLIESGQTCVLAFTGDEFELTGAGKYKVRVDSTQDLQKLLEEVFGSDRAPWRGILHFWSLDQAVGSEITPELLKTAQVVGCGSVLRLIKAIAERGVREPPPLWLVSRSTQAIDFADASVGLAQAPLWGLGRVTMHEHPELQCRLVDLGLPTPEEDARALFDLLMDSNLQDRENQIALRQDGVYLARLEECGPQDRKPGRFGVNTDDIETDGRSPLHLEIATTGILDNLAWRPFVVPPLGRGEVEIDIQAIGLNFKDILLATGVIPPPPVGPVELGWECAGTITAVGPGVEDLRQGDEVLALAASCFGTVAVIPACLAVRRPANLTLEEAAAFPVAFVTAHYALHTLGRIKKGERVLVHAAASGVGLAAVQLAQGAGAEIFATAGSDYKRGFVASLGVKHVMDSRSLDFADQVMDITNGEGVDLVVNSLGAEFVSKTLSVLRPCGRFLQLAKTDISHPISAGLSDLQNNLSFFSIDLARLLIDQTEACGQLLRDLVKDAERGALKPLPVKTFALSEVTEAFRHMARGKHIGKLVVKADARKTFAFPASEPLVTFRPDSTYLITGGMGGLGRVVAGWMLQRGAKHLVLVGRTDMSIAHDHSVDALRESGAELTYLRCDVSSEDDVAAMLAHIAVTLPPLKGIVHAAGLLDDGILLNLNQDRLETVMAPKVYGSWNLHHLTTDHHLLDFFVLFSSIASLIGAPGQGNYSAANSFMDALAHYRHASGLPALSINWGPWSEVGLAARIGYRRRAPNTGVPPISPSEAVRLLDQLFLWPSPQVAVMPFDVARWCRTHPSVSQSSLFTTLLDKIDASTKSSSQKQPPLVDAPHEMRQRLTEEYLAGQLARILRLPSPKLDVSTPLSRLGLDSLVAVELRNIIKADIGVEITTLSLLKGVNISQLASQILDRIGQSERPGAVTSNGDREHAHHVLEQVANMSDAAANALLADLLRSKK